MPPPPVGGMPPPMPNANQPAMKEEVKVEDGRGFESGKRPREEDDAAGGDTKRIKTES